MLDTLDRLPVEIIQDFRKTGKSLAIPKEVQRYIVHIDRAAELHRFEPNLSRISRQLMDEFPEDKMSFKTANSRVYDAINYFHLNMTVRNEAWDNYYAGRFDDTAMVCLAAKQFNPAIRALEKAHQLRTNKKEDSIPAEALKHKDFITSPDTTPERLGITPVNLKEIHRRGMAIIDNKLTDLSDAEKKQVKQELSDATGITDIEADE